MLFSVITPNFNGGRFLEQSIQSVIAQRQDEIDLEYIVIDGNSTDNSLEILDKYSKDISKIVIEDDTGPANAINKGIALASGDIVSWLNADDIYYPGALDRVRKAVISHPDVSIAFGSCPIIDHEGIETRSGISVFKEFFFPLSSRFTYQCINYLSQPALFFNKTAVNQAGPLREDMLAAWDYEFILRLWRSGPAIKVSNEPLAAFRWHEQSISGQNFSVQFKEEYESARYDAGKISLQTFIHFFVRWGIVGIYSLMAAKRKLNQGSKTA